MLMSCFSYLSPINLCFNREVPNFSLPRSPKNIRISSRRKKYILSSMLHTKKEDAVSKCKKAVFFLFALILPILISSRLICIRAQDIQPRIYLEGAMDDSSGIFILKIMFSPQGSMLCGLELDITYDPAKTMICSCERGDALKSLEFDCSLGEGRIRLLLWGEENSEIGGRIATLCFLPLDGYDGEIEFILSLPTKSSAVYFEDNRILSQNILLSGLRIDPDLSELPTDSFVEHPTESPSSSEQSHPSAERPTEEIAENTESVSEYPSDTGPPQSQKGGFFRKLLAALLCFETAAGLLSLFPIFLPRVFRKGYF